MLSSSRLLDVAARMQLNLSLIRSTGGRFESQLLTIILLDRKHLIVVIYINEYLSSDEINESTSLPENNLLPSAEDENLISFPSDSDEQISSEEIGKWVDQLMEMPERDLDLPELDGGMQSFQDPFEVIAERILSEE